MAIVKFNDIEKGRWYNISLYADKCKSYGRTIKYFEAKYDGIWWADEKGVQYSVHHVLFIDDELAF